MIRILTWDPGASGAFAWIRYPGLKWDNHRRQWLGGSICVSDSDDQSLKFVVRSIVPMANFIVYEEQTGYGGSKFKSTAFFEFGHRFGRTQGRIEERIDGLPAVAKLPKLVGVLPQRWQKPLALTKPKHEDKVKRRQLWKRALRDEAIRMYPDCPFRITLDNCDALLLLHYAHFHCLA